MTGARVTPIGTALAQSSQSYDEKLQSAVHAVDAAEDRCKAINKMLSDAQVARDHAKRDLLELMDGDMLVYGDQLLTRDGKGGIRKQKVRVVGLL